MATEADKPSPSKAEGTSENNNCAEDVMLDGDDMIVVVDVDVDARTRLFSTQNIPDQDRWDVMPSMEELLNSSIGSSSRNSGTRLSSSWTSIPLLVLNLDKSRYMTELHESICELPHLQKLIVTHCNELRSLPEGIGKLSNLQVLDLSDSPLIERLPDTIGDLGNLKKLVLGGSDGTGNKLLKKLPESLGQLQNLEVLMLNKCKTLLSLPNSIGQLSHLKSLFMIECKCITELPNSILKCTNLVEISLSKCISLSHLPSEGGQPQPLYQYGSDVVVQQQVPTTVWPHLEDLILTKCKRLEYLPHTLGHNDFCPILCHLDLRGCKALTTLPTSVGHLKNTLKYLNMSQCKNLVTIPQELGNLTALRYISVEDCNNLTSIPDTCIQQFKNVMEGWSWKDEENAVLDE